MIRDSLLPGQWQVRCEIISAVTPLCEKSGFRTGSGKPEYRFIEARERNCLLLSMQFHRVRNALLAALLSGVLFSGCVTTTGATGRAVINAKNKVAPSLVHIRPVKEVFTQGRREEVLVLGSGFIISADGYVITNEHVAGESNFVKCVLGTREEVEAEVVGVDPWTDIAVLKLEADHPLPFAELGDSARLEAGQMVLALGSPHGLARSVSLGIVSVTDRYLGSMGTKTAPYNNWIQTDAAINPGNSGGPLVNLAGEVIGVNARMLSGAENVGFAIPINIAREAVDEIIRNGRVKRSWIGVTLQEMLARTENPEKQGVVIADVDPISPASETGILPGDMLIAVNDTPVNARFAEDLPAIRKRIADLPVGAEARLRLLRGGREITIRVKTEEMSRLKGTEVEFGEWAFTATELTAEIVRRARLDSRLGVLISGVQAGGPASQAGIKEGDIILEMDTVPVQGLAHFGELYRQRIEENPPRILLLVKRGALTRYVMVKQDNGGGTEEDTDAEK
jgi:serine protease Do